MTPSETAKTTVPSKQDLLVSKTRIHLGYLDGLRALAAFYVLLHHAAYTVWPHFSELQGLKLALVAPLQYGRYAVELFIVLSGFCLMLPIVTGNGTLRGGALAFFKRRARRILPPYYCALILSVLLITTLIGQKTGTHWDVSLPVTRSAIFSCLLLTQDVFGRLKINHTFWSIAVEWHIYFLFPLLVLSTIRFGVIRTTAVIVVASSVLLMAVRRTPLVGAMPQFVALFALGMFAATIAYAKEQSWERLRTIPYWGPLALGIGFVLIAPDLMGYKPTNLLRVLALDLLAGVGALSLLIAASREGMLQRLLSWRPLVWAGTFAYSIYLIHAPLLQVVWQYALHPLHLAPVPTFLLLVTIGAATIVGASYLFFLACERPFLSTRRHEPLGEVARDAALSPAP